jgi:7,8-dihydropterin-6-yl-methyl-4-(beta-D-ribofuranosyl)aminobenzene 5'-phosphate synthase
MNVNLKVLVENTTPDARLQGEYGFALQVVTDNCNILFDTGSNQAVIYNSAALGVDLNKVQEIIISHGHFDHTGAVMTLIKKYGINKIYSHSGIFSPRFALLNKDKKVDIGCKFSYQEAREQGVEFTFINQFTQIHPGIYLTGEIPRVTGFEDVGGDFVIEQDGKLLNDQLIDDMAMVIDHPQGLIIISGCSHSGIINTIEYCIKKTGKSEILAYVGGTHLINASRERLDKTIKALMKYNIKQLIVGHCTGFYAAAALYNQLGNKIVTMAAGMSFVFNQ